MFLREPKRAFSYFSSVFISSPTVPRSPTIESFSFNRCSVPSDNFPASEIIWYKKSIFFESISTCLVKSIFFSFNSLSIILFASTSPSILEQYFLFSSRKFSIRFRSVKRLFKILSLLDNLSLIKVLSFTIEESFSSFCRKSSSILSCFLPSSEYFSISSTIFVWAVDNLFFLS